MEIRPAGYIWIALLLAVTVLIVYSAAIYPWILDDSYISFRYAENLVAGKGLVFNEGERVEGYTNFLWVIVLAIGKLSGIDLVIFSRILGIMFSLGCLILILNSHRFIKEIDHNVSAIAVLILGTNGVFLPWGVSGMEVTLFTFLILLTVLYYVSLRENDDARKFLTLGALCGLIMLVRPEGLLLSAAIVAYHLYYRETKRPVIFLLGMILLIYLPYLIWRYSYYGYPFPNTFYAKVGLSINQVLRGLKYIVKFAIPSLMILLPLIDPSAVSGWLRKYRRLVILPLICSIYTIYNILVGGDSMPALRFFAPIMPIICLLSAMTIRSIHKRPLIVLYMVGILAYNLAALNFYYITPYIKYDRVAEFGTEVGSWLRQHVPADAVIATNTAGSIPYYSGLKTIDMLGLNDLHIAHSKIRDFGSGWPGHEKADGEYVLSKKPDLVQLGSSYGEKIAVFPGDYQLLGNPEFYENYRLREIAMPSGHTLLIYENRLHPVLPENGEKRDTVSIESPMSGVVPGCLFNR